MRDLTRVLEAIDAFVAAYNQFFHLQGRPSDDDDRHHLSGIAIFVRSKLKKGDAVSLYQVGQYMKGALEHFAGFPLIDQALHKLDSQILAYLKAPEVTDEHARTIY